MFFPGGEQVEQRRLSRAVCNAFRVAGCKYYNDLTLLSIKKDICYTVRGRGRSCHPRDVLQTASLYFSRTYTWIGVPLASPVESSANLSYDTASVKHFVFRTCYVDKGQAVVLARTPELNRAWTCSLVSQVMTAWFQEEVNIPIKYKPKTEDRGRVL